MSKLQELIKELCPDGVEFKKLEEVCEIFSGKNKQKKEQGKYPVYGSTGIIAYCDNYQYDKEQLLIARVGANAGFIHIANGKYDVSDNTLIVDVIGTCNSIYIYYVLVNSNINRYSKGGGQPLVTASDIKKIEIPLPPLEVQNEIVRILDTFTAHTAELQAELQARKEQFEYYRNKLLTFDENDEGVKWMKLGEIGNTCMCKRIMKHQTSDIGEVPFFKIGTFGKEADAFISYELYDEYKNKYSFPRKGEILISASGTIGRTVIYDGQDAYFQDSNIIWIQNDESKVLNKYLYYYYQIIEWNVEGGTIKRLYNTNLSKTIIAYPPLSEQKRIISILDKFESLVNDLSEGLPTEIAAVQEQYEYYRNKLLTFKRKS